MTTESMTPERPATPEARLIEAAKRMGICIESLAPQELGRISARFGDEASRARFYSTLGDHAPGLWSHLKRRMAWLTLDWFDPEAKDDLSFLHEPVAVADRLAGDESYYDHYYPDDRGYRVDPVHASFPEQHLVPITEVLECVAAGRPATGHDVPYAEQAPRPSYAKLLRPLMTDDDEFRLLDEAKAAERLLDISRKAGEARDAGDLEAAWGHIHQARALRNALLAWRRGVLEYR